MGILYLKPGSKNQLSDVKERDLTGELMERYWIQAAQHRGIGPRSFAGFELTMPWPIERHELGRTRNEPGDGFRYVFRTGSAGTEGRTEWFEVTEVFEGVEAKDIEAFMRIGNGGAAGFDFDRGGFVNGLNIGIPSRASQKRAAGKVIEAVDEKLNKPSYKGMWREHGYGTLIVGLPLLFAMQPANPLRVENVVDDFYIFTGGAIERATVDAADLIVLAGLDPVELIPKPWPYRAPVLDLCACTHAPHYVAPAVRVEGDLAETLRKLADAPATSDWSAARIARCRDTFYSDMGMPGGGALSPEAVVREVGRAFEFMPRAAIDAGAHMFSACAFWKAGSPLDLLISNGLASMGFALPAAIAAALHDPGRGAVALTGDGGLMMCLGELKTAATAGADLTVVVFNDARLSLIDIKREQRQMQDLGLSWDAPDFARIADGFGFTVWTAGTREEMRSAAKAAAAGSGPRLIEARIDASGYLQQMRALRG